MHDAVPGVRRLCAAVDGGPPDLLAVACTAGGLPRLYVGTASGGGTAIAVAPPGVDEVETVGRLVSALHLLTSRIDAPPARVSVAFHVGILRVEGEGFGGAAVARALAILGNAAVRGAVGADDPDPGPGLVVAVSDAFFGELLAEGWSGDGWQPAAAAGAWLKRYPPTSRADTPPG